eukprot:c8543_g1_i2.p1 GENE.c8543_g1_i2~~c8543_g1_i2.p1  ORF type:complete len:169 (+),score=24.25 c8543_g1_i2:321-827(+)
MFVVYYVVWTFNFLVYATLISLPEHRTFNFVSFLHFVWTFDCISFSFISGIPFIADFRFISFLTHFFVCIRTVSVLTCLMISITRVITSSTYNIALGGDAVCAVAGGRRIVGAGLDCQILALLLAIFMFAMSILSFTYLLAQSVKKHLPHSQSHHNHPKKSPKTVPIV